MNIFNFYHFVLFILYFCRCHRFDAAAVRVTVSPSPSRSLIQAIAYYLLFLLPTFFFLSSSSFAITTNDRIRLDVSHLFDADILFAFKLCGVGDSSFSHPLTSHSPTRKNWSVRGECETTWKKEGDEKTHTPKRVKRWYIACVWKWNIFIKMKMGKHACDMQRQQQSADTRRWRRRRRLLEHCLHLHGFAWKWMTGESRSNRAEIIESYFIRNAYMWRIFLWRKETRAPSEREWNSMYRMVEGCDGVLYTVANGL